MIDLSTPQRQSPLAIVFLALRVIRRIGITQFALIVVFIVTGPEGLALFVIPLVLILALGVISGLGWWRYTFRFVNDELIVQKGVFRSDRLIVRSERIQSISTDQQLLHRMVGLVQVSVDTAGSSDAEFEIDAVSRTVAQALEEQVLQGRSASAAIAGSGVVGATPGDGHRNTAERVVFRHRPTRLVITALTIWPLSGLVVLGPVFAFQGPLDGVIPERFVENVSDNAQLWWAPIAALVLVVLSIVLNLGRVLLQDWDLVVRSGSASIRRTSGLLSKTSRASSTARVQVLRSTQNPLQRAAGVQSVKLTTIGEGNLDILGCDDDETNSLRSLVELDRGAVQAADRRIDRAELPLAVRNTAALTAVVAAALWLWIGPWALLVFSVVALRWWTTARHVARFRWSLGDELVTFDHVVRTEANQTLLRKANAVTVTQSFFERRRGLAHVELATAAGSLSVGMIPVTEAEAVRDVVLHAVETDRRAWI